MTVWTFDATQHIDELAELNASRIESGKTPNQTQAKSQKCESRAPQPEPGRDGGGGPEPSGNSTELSSNYAASYTMVSFPQQLQVRATMHHHHHRYRRRRHHRHHRRRCRALPSTRSECGVPWGDVCPPPVTWESLTP